MNPPSILVALLSSLLAAFIVVVNAMPPLAFGMDKSPQGSVVAQAEGGSSVRRGDREQEFRQGVERDHLRGTFFDCHRDIRTHRINGVQVRHRHVGDDCEVRIVRQSTVPAPAD